MSSISHRVIDLSLHSKRRIARHALTAPRAESYTNLNKHEVLEVEDAKSCHHPCANPRWFRGSFYPPFLGYMQRYSTQGTMPREPHSSFQN